MKRKLLRAKGIPIPRAAKGEHAHTADQLTFNKLRLTATGAGRRGGR